MPLSASTPLFATHHAFPGAFASLTFGQPGHGAGLEALGRFAALIEWGT